MIELDWAGCYREQWKGVIVEDAFRHPAKFSRSLIRRIYEYAFDMGWLHVGDRVIDPFGGVALGALDAMRLGMDWTGVELERHFVELGNKNIAAWNTRFSGKIPNWGTARLLQGDSRNLAAIVDHGMAATISSPPYADGCSHTGGDDTHPERAQGGIANGNYHGVGLDGANSSPPHADGAASEIAGVGDTPARRQVAGKSRPKRERGYSGAISSPPFGSGAEGGTRASKFKNPEGFAREMAARDGTTPNRHSASPEARLRQLEREDRAVYGETEGQLGAMPSGEFMAGISSPPYGGSNQHYEEGWKYIDKDKLAHNRYSKQREASYGATDGQLAQADNFWSASRLILEQLHQILSPRSVAIWVLKDYVRYGKRVPFCDQWRQLCEAIGFETLGFARAWLVDDRGTQLAMDGNHKSYKRERKSFFRRLAEQKGSPKIDCEVVLFTRKT